jgi:quercetin dioxygenase-like cupin family protein
LGADYQGLGLYGGQLMDGFEPGRFAPPPPGRFGFTACATPAQGLRRLMLATGRLPPGDLHALHQHQGDEVLHILEGEVTLRLGDARRRCGPGDVIAVPPRTWHAMLTLTEVALAVVAELGMGTQYARADADGAWLPVPVNRRDIPWSPPLPLGGAYTTDAELAAIIREARMLDELRV